MRYGSVPLLLLALLWIFASAAGLRAAGDPGTLFLQAYETYQAGAKLELDGKPDDALQKFRFCVGVLEQLQKNSPGYEPIVVDFRLKKSRLAIARIESLRSAPSLPQAVAPAPSVETPPSRPRPAARVGNAFGFSDDYRLPVPRSAGAGGKPSRPAAPSGETSALHAEIRSLRALIGDLSQEKEDLKEQLLESNARERSALVEVDRQKSRYVEIMSQLTEAHQNLDDLQETTDRLSREKAADERHIAKLESDLEAARADLEVAEEYNGELFAKLEQASQFIEAGEKIRKQLLAERKDLVSRIEAGGREGNVKLAQAEKARDTAQAEKQALEKRIDSVAKIEERNKSLTTQLDLTEKRLADLSKDDGERRKIEAGLRNEIEAVTKSLAAMDDQLESGRARIAELEKQLADTASATAGVTGAMADENALLKSLVTRQLQEQAKRQQARKLVTEEMEKLQVRSTTLLSRLDAMAAAETSLTPQERKLVERRVVPTTGPSDFSLEVVKKMPESDLPPELVAKAAQANELSQKRQFAEARGIYEEVAKNAPQSYLAAVNLGIAERQLGNYPQAIAAFRRALEIKQDDPFALTNLGTVEYRAGNLQDAVRVLKQAVAVDAESYLAHYLLGMALNDLGEQAEALSEVRKSLDLKPDYAPAKELFVEIGEGSRGVSAPTATPAEIISNP